MTWTPLQSSISREKNFGINTKLHADKTEISFRTCLSNQMFERTLSNYPVNNINLGHVPTFLASPYTKTLGANKANPVLISVENSLNNRDSRLTR